MLIQWNDDLRYINVYDANYIIYDKDNKVVYTVDKFGSFLLNRTREKIELNELIYSVLKEFNLNDLYDEVEKYVDVLIKKGIIVVIT